MSAHFAGPVIISHQLYAALVQWTPWRHCSRGYYYN